MAFAIAIWAMPGLSAVPCTATAHHALTSGGWLSFGYHSEGNDLFNSRPDEIALHQAWLYAEKVATCENPFGFRADLMYGIDADDTQAFGNPNGKLGL